MPRFFLIAFMSSFLLIESCISQSSEANKDVPEIKVGINVGDRAPEIAYPDPEGKVIPLSTLRGKIILIDFWASWCPPCRRENPSIVKCYKEYKDKSFVKGKGFSIYSIGCENNKSAWISAIEDDELIWEYHVSDLKGWEAEATYIYNISAIPANFLIDAEGIILAKDLHGDELRTTLESLLKK